MTRTGEPALWRRINEAAPWSNATACDSLFAKDETALVRVAWQLAYGFAGAKLAKRLPQDLRRRP
jgi:hypothetical protein